MTAVSYPRMGRHNTEAGVSPALSRNCIPQFMWRARSNAVVVDSTSLAARRWNSVNKTKTNLPVLTAGIFV
jgi:hypothetical protein